MTRDRSHQAQQNENVYAPMRSSLSAMPNASPELAPLAVTIIITLAVLATAYSIMGQKLPIAPAILQTMDGLVMGLVVALLPGSRMNDWRHKYGLILRSLAYLVAVMLMSPLPLGEIIHPYVPATIAVLVSLIYALERSLRSRQAHSSA